MIHELLTEQFERLEAAIDVHLLLTREYTPDGRRNSASFTVSRNGRWSALIPARLTKARTRTMHTIHASGETPAEATDRLIAELDHWTEVLA